MEAPCRFKFSGTGGELFGKLFVGMILLIITFGLYTPWFICKLISWANENTVLEDDFGNTVQLKFTGTGGTLFGIYIGGVLLSMLTLGIYQFWFRVNMMKFTMGIPKLSPPRATCSAWNLTARVANYSV